jgi:hypothetical protein
LTRARNSLRMNLRIKHGLRIIFQIMLRAYAGDEVEEARGLTMQIEVKLPFYQ